MAQDFSQADDPAKQNPDKLRELQDLFWAEGARYDVLPLDASFAERLDPAIRPSLTRGRMHGPAKRTAGAAVLSEAISPHWLRHAHGSHALVRGRRCPN